MHNVAYFLSANIGTKLGLEHEQGLTKRWLDALKSRGITEYAYEQAFAGTYSRIPAVN